MGRLPDQSSFQEDKDGFISVGGKEMLSALESTLEALVDGSITTADFSFRFKTAEMNQQAGSLHGMSRRRATGLSSEMYIAVRTTFEAVENGLLSEGGYYFELTTPHFHFSSGYYPPQDKDGSAWLDDAHELISIRCQRMLFAIHLRYMIQLTVAMEVVLLLCQPLHVGASPFPKEEPPLTLTAGTNGIVPFECSNEHQSASKYYTVKFEGKDRPFYIDGNLDPEGLMSPDQAERFRVEYHEEGSAMSVEISIASVSVEDQGTYVVMVIVQLGGAHEYHSMKRVVIIIIPPGPAECFLMRSESLKDYYQIHCNSKPGNGNSTITCFQNNEKMPFLKDTSNPNQVAHYRRIFWLMNLDIPFSCCAHDIEKTDFITQDSCDQYRYPRIEPVTRPLPPGNEDPPEIGLTTEPLPTEKENEKLPAEATSHSGCTQNFAWPTLLLPVMIVMTYVCISNP